MFPRDTISFYADITATNKTLLLSTSTRTILYANIFSNNSTPIGTLFCGTIEIYDQKGDVNRELGVPLNYVCSSAIYVNKTSSPGEFSIYIDYVARDRTITADVVSEVQNTVTVSNFPSGFNINNWQLATSTTVLNLSTSTLSGLNVNCQNCVASTTTFGTGTPNITINGGYNGLNYQESLFIACIVIAILSIGMYRFIFRRPPLL